MIESILTISRITRWCSTWFWCPYLGFHMGSRNNPALLMGSAFQAQELAETSHQMKKTAYCFAKIQKVVWYKSRTKKNNLHDISNVLIECGWFTFFLDVKYCELFQDCGVLSEESCHGKIKVNQYMLIQDKVILCFKIVWVENKNVRFQTPYASPGGSALGKFWTRLFLSIQGNQNIINYLIDIVC